jgi:hypothetical protein
MATAISFKEFRRIIEADPSRIVISPPEMEASKKNGGKIPTGLLKCKDEDGVPKNMNMYGPPCTVLYPLNNEGVSRFGKFSLVLPKEADMQPEAFENLPDHVKERVEFVRFTQALEQIALDRIKGDVATYFGREVRNLALSEAVVPSLNPDHGSLMSCKVDLVDNSIRENVPPANIRIKIQDLDGVTEIAIVDMRKGDLYIPIFNSVYPYFDRSRGKTGLKWKLVGLQAVRRGSPSGGEGGAANSIPWINRDVFEKVFEKYKDATATAFSGKRAREEEEEEETRPSPKAVRGEGAEKEEEVEVAA